MTASVSCGKASGREAGAARVHRGMLLCLLVLLFQPETPSDGTRPRHNPGLSPLEKTSGRKSCQDSPGQVRLPQNTPQHGLISSRTVTRLGQDGSERSIRMTGDGLTW